MQNLNIAIIQFSPVWNDQFSNLLYLENQIKALQPNQQIVLLPEMFDCGFMAANQANTNESGLLTLNWLQSCAKRYNIAICGTCSIFENNTRYNRMIMTMPDGQIQYYNKRHLFTPGNENQYYTAGTERKIWNFESISILPLICYDLRFPVWSRNQNDYQLILLSANWPVSRQNVWEILCKARAIENQAYIIACNITGTDGNNIEYKGGSSVIDFKGDTVAQLGNENATLYACIDFDALFDFRDKFKTANDADNFMLIK